MLVEDNKSMIIQVFHKISLSQSTYIKKSNKNVANKCEKKNKEKIQMKDKSIFFSIMTAAIHQA
jgi:hypothetical protein